MFQTWEKLGFKSMKTNDQNFNTGGTLNEYKNSGAYHSELNLSRLWLPRYFRRLHIAQELITKFLSADAKIADIGGGEGILVEKLYEVGFKDSISVDPYAPLINEYIKRGSILELPFEAESFDAVTCLDVLEHIPLNLQLKACQELFRILDKNGFAIISVPNTAHFKSRIDFLLKGRHWRNKLEKHPGELSVAERIQVLEEAGFLVLDTLGIHLTLTYDPAPKGMFGKALTRIMFSNKIPTSLCWTTLILLGKNNTSSITRKLQHGTLRKLMTSYMPHDADPTCRAFI